jgi:hypothetical protein
MTGAATEACQDMAGPWAKATKKAQQKESDPVEAAKLAKRKYGSLPASRRWREGALTGQTPPGRVLYPGAPVYCVLPSWLWQTSNTVEATLCKYSRWGGRHGILVRTLFESALCVRVAA